MNDQQFDELLQSVRDMGRHMRGEQVAGVRVHEFSEPDVKAIRERAGLSQTRFAHLIRSHAKNAEKLGTTAGKTLRAGACVAENCGSQAGCLVGA